ncbi:sensor histidine kinase [Flavobacterium sp. HJSW_4]|uniref:sensor histidine kinase n=1 Tax=Flavobacterium sp. HJSW_4 TaxID=3344660 RepID=UPI0035F4F305
MNSLLVSKMFSFFKLKLSYRKIIHYVLLATVILLQIIVIGIWYNEKLGQSETVKDLDSINSLNKLSQINNQINYSFINSQKSFNNYKLNKNKESLKRYINSLKGVNTLIDSLNLLTGKDKQFARVLIQKKNAERIIQNLQANIDSIINVQVDPKRNNISKLFLLNEFEYKKILDSIKTESYVKTDSVSKKKLFNRLGDALKGKREVQKEQVNTIITMKFNNKVVTGSVEEQMANIFNTTFNYYDYQFKSLKKNFISLREQDEKLTELNNRLLILQDALMPVFSKAINSLENDAQKRLRNRSDSNVIVKNYTIVILVMIMLIISLIILSFTRFSFYYEKKLTSAQIKIMKNLSFKNRIMGMISHEIRSPLSVISIYVKILSRSAMDPEMKESFKVIDFTTSSLMLLTNQILEYSKNEGQDLKLNNRKFHLAEEINQIVGSMFSLVESKGNRIEINSRLDTSYNVNADVVKIHQLFYNLIGNANKFTTEGLISVFVDYEVIEDKKLNLKVEIIDSGAGISEDDLKNVFDKFYQGAFLNRTNDLGVGLGLNLCKEIVELFDGKISVESKQNQGTKVSFNLILSLLY